MASWLLRTLVLTIAASAALYAGACDKDATEDDSLQDVIYVNTNDEALELLLATPIASDPAKAAVLTSPAEGASVPSSPTQTFQWEIGAGSSGALVPMAPPRRRSSPGGILGPMRAAYAHGAPVNGTAYYVVFSTPDDDSLVRLFTSETSYQPDVAVWQKMVAAGAPIRCVITTAIFDNNLLAPDGGPFAGNAVTFTIAP